MAYYHSSNTDINGVVDNELWDITDGVARRLGDGSVLPSQRVCGPKHFLANPGETAWAKMRREEPEWFIRGKEKAFAEMVLPPGRFYPRMARKIAFGQVTLTSWEPTAAGEETFVALACTQLTSLTRQLDRICQTVHPVEETLATYGHDIRNLLILTCTDIEMHWRGVLKSNGGLTKYNGTKFDDKDYKTSSYVKLLKPMRLDEYTVKFPKYPWLTHFKPFQGWDSSRSSESLPWYMSYNAVKHDRENEFKQATLRSAFEAISACIIMIVAQFGLGWVRNHGAEINTYYQFLENPQWGIHESYYTIPGPLDEKNPLGNWVPQNFTF
jgi:hypothetical protein